jgi:PAS domain S-box-containing protein
VGAPIATASQPTPLLEDIKAQKTPLGHRLDWFVRLCGVWAASIGAIWLALWLAGVAARWSAAGALIPKTNMALGMTLGAASLLLLADQWISRARRWTGTALAAMVFLIGGLTLSEHVFGYDLGIDQILATEQPGAAGTAAPNRVGPPGSLSLALLGLALLAVGVGRRRWVPYLALAVYLVNMAALLGHLYGATEFYSQNLTGIAWPTVTALLMLALGLMASVRERGPTYLLMQDDSGGLMLRRLLPAIVLLPIILGWLRVQGQYRGWYDTAGGTAWLTLGLIVLFAALLWRNADSLSRSAAARKTAAEALHQSEENYRELFESIDQGFCTIEVLFDENENPIDYRFLMVNPAFERQTGIPDAAGRRMREIVPLHEEHWFQIYGRIALTGEPMRFENPATQLQRYYEGLAWKIGAPSERKVAILFNDISDRRRAEAALRESEGQFRTLANAIPQLSWMANAEGSTFWYNERWYEYTGTKPDQMEGWGWQSVHDATVLPNVLDRWRESIATGEPFDMVFPLRGADGVFRPFLTRVMPMRDRDGKVARWFGTNTDITEQRRIEEALATSESRLRALLESASQGVVAVDETGRILLINARTEELFGYSRDELIGQPLELLVPEHLRALHAGHQRQYFASPRTRPMGAGLDLRGRTKDGSDFSLEISLSFIEEGGKRLALALITDITEREQAEERLRRSQKLESLGLLAGGVAHDFNNLLVGVIGNASLAQELLPPDHPAVGLMDGVLKAGEHAAHLTRQMLAYSGKGKFFVEPLNLSALIPDMCGLVRPSISKKTALQLDLEEDLPVVEADRGQVQQVFMNLAHNAAEAIGGEGLITVRTAVQDVDAPYIRLHPELAALVPGRYVCLQVRDTGCGMDEATKAKIFDPFFSTKFTGRGLGLAAVSGILRGHKSGMTVSSAPGKGSCFTVLFPATARETGKRPVVGGDASLQGAGTVLVVDDEQVVRELAKRALEHHGYTVLMADGGASAIDVFKRHPGEILLVVLDLSMPHMSGEEALPELRKIRPEVKVVVSSGYSESEAMPLFDGQRVSGFVQKPYTSKAIADKVKDCLG